MGDVVILNGPPGVGKTVTAGILASALPGTVCIHGDDLRAFCPSDARKHLGGGSTYRAAAALTAEYLHMGAPRVVFDYVFLRPAHRSYFLDRLSEAAETQVQFFTLWAPLEIVQTRERSRSGREPLGAAIAECWQEIASYREGLGEFVDNAGADAFETARRISALIEAGAGRTGSLKTDVHALVAGQDRDGGARRTPQGIDASQLRSRLELRKSQYLCERFAPSPNLTERLSVADHLDIKYAVWDAPIVPWLRDSLGQAYRNVKSWFGYRGDLPVTLYVASDVTDWQYMTCLPCEEGFACAPGTHDGSNVVVLPAPQWCRPDPDSTTTAAVLAHEIAHHFVREVSHSTVFSLCRRQNLDVPMWLEEGLCQVIESELSPKLRRKWAEGIARTEAWFALEDLWDDLSAQEDVKTAYLQAYKETRELLVREGKEKTIQLLHRNRTHHVNWTYLTEGTPALRRLEHDIASGLSHARALRRRGEPSSDRQ